MSSYPIEFVNKLTPKDQSLTVILQDAPPPAIEQSIVAPTPCPPCPDPFITIAPRWDNLRYDGFASGFVRKIQVVLSKAPDVDQTVHLATSDASIVAFAYDGTPTLDVVIIAGQLQAEATFFILSVGGPVSICGTTDDNVYAAGCIFFTTIDPAFTVRYQWYSQSAIFASSGGDSALFGDWSAPTLDYHDRAFILIWIEGVTASVMPDLSTAWYQWGVSVSGCAVVSFATYDTRAFAIMLKDACAPGATITLNLTFNGDSAPTDAIGHSFPIVFTFA